MTGKTRIVRGRRSANHVEAYLILPPGHRFNPGAGYLNRRFYITNPSGGSPVVCSDPRWYKLGIHFVYTGFAERERLPDINRVWASADTLMHELKRNLLIAMARDGTPQLFAGSSHRLVVDNDNTQ